MMLERPRPICVATFISFAFICCLSSEALALKDVNESCEADSECQSGHCVTVKVPDEEDQKVCCNCDQDKLAYYTTPVNDNCHNLGKNIFGYNDLPEPDSKDEVSLIELNYRAKYVKECLGARLSRENECWAGGNPGHKEQIEELKKTTNLLQVLIDEKTSNKLAYNCQRDRFDHIQEDIDHNCKGIDDLFEKYGGKDEAGKEVSCNDIDDLVDKCVDCKEALKDMVDTCFSNGAPDVRAKRLNDVRGMEEIAKEKKESMCK